MRNQDAQALRTLPKQIFCKTRLGCSDTTINTRVNKTEARLLCLPEKMGERRVSHVIALAVIHTQYTGLDLSQTKRSVPRFVRKTSFSNICHRGQGSVGNSYLLESQASILGVKVECRQTQTVGAGRSPISLPKSTQSCDCCKFRAKEETTFRFQAFWQTYNKSKQIMFVYERG